MISSVSQYVLSVCHLDTMSLTLRNRDISPIYEDSDSHRPKCLIGNSVIIFEVLYKGRHTAMRVYMRPNPNLRRIYGDSYFPKELLVQSGAMEYGLADVVLCDWYDGESLRTKIEEYRSKPAKMMQLSQMFEELALSLLGERWAHGDIKPENIILSKDGLHLIDFDAMYCEGFSADDCVEIGTRNFQHPQRSSHFGKYIDDYPIALISTVLAAMAIDPTVGRELPALDYLLIRPNLAVEGCDPMLEVIERIFAEKGDVRHYRIAKLLRSNHPSLPQLKGLLEGLTARDVAPENLSLEYDNGYWGFTENGRFVIPPLYDLAFEFSEGLALVMIGDVWHFIDVEGKVVISCGRGSGVKPFSDGKSRIIREDGEFIIHRNGVMERC